MFFELAFLRAFEEFSKGEKRDRLLRVLKRREKFVFLSGLPRVCKRGTKKRKTKREEVSF